MLRKALIIGSPDATIPGVYDDMKAYRAFLQGVVGGAWEASEITTLESPTKEAVEREARALTNADYSITVFAGHGSYSADEKATRVQIRPHVDISENLLKVGAPKHTLIIDACRVVTAGNLQKRSAIVALTMDSFRDRYSYRHAFESELAKCPPGLAVMYSCSIGETAGEITGEGGIFSSTLLSDSPRWAQRGSRTSGALSVREALESAAESVRTQTASRQNPRGAFPRAVPHFPFALSSW